MYFSMDEIGFENTEKIKKIPLEADRWKFINDVAKAYGFEGIHLTPCILSRFLAIGDGEIDFPKLLKGFNNIPNLYAALEIKASNDGVAKSLRMLQNI